MKMEPISVYAINATVVSDITPTGRPKNVVRLNYDAGTAVDRVQICSDYRKIGKPSSLEGEVFIKDNDFLAYSFNPLNDSSVYLLTCRVSQTNCSKEEAFKLVESGMKKAFEKLNELYSKHR